MICSKFIVTLVFHCHWFNVSCICNLIHICLLVNINRVFIFSIMWPSSAKYIQMQMESREIPRFSGPPPRLFVLFYSLQDYFLVVSCNALCWNTNENTMNPLYLIFGIFVQDTLRYYFDNHCSAYCVFNWVLATKNVLTNTNRVRHRIVGFEVRARSVDVARYEGNPSDLNDMSCKVKPVNDDKGGLILNSKSS